MGTFLAVDFGAGRGRVIAGTVSGGRLNTVEVHRFPNRQIRLGNRLYWDFLSLFEEMKTGLRMAAGQFSDIRSIGIDTWGVDFGLVDRDGNLLGNPVCYRDPSMDGESEVWGRVYDIAADFSSGVIVVMSFNNLF